MIIEFQKRNLWSLGKSIFRFFFHFVTLWSAFDVSIKCDGTQIAFAPFGKKGTIESKSPDFSLFFQVQRCYEAQLSRIHGPVPVLHVSSVSCDVKLEKSLFDFFFKQSYNPAEVRFEDAQPDWLFPAPGSCPVCLKDHQRKRGEKPICCGLQINQV